MTITTISSSTKSTNKANSALARRRERRRNSASDQSSPRSDTARELATTPTRSEPLSPIRKEQPAPASTVTPDSAVSSERRHDQEKANNYLSQRRARRRKARQSNPPATTQDIEPNPAAPPSPATVEQIITPPIMSAPQRLIVLISDGVSDRIQASNQSRALQLLKTKKITYVTVDGMDTNQRARYVRLLSK
jgi:hypothetical protein